MHLYAARIIQNHLNWIKFSSWTPLFYLVFKYLEGCVWHKQNLSAPRRRASILAANLSISFDSSLWFSCQTVPYSLQQDRILSRVAFWLTHPFNFESLLVDGFLEVDRDDMWLILPIAPWSFTDLKLKGISRHLQIGLWIDTEYCPAMCGALDTKSHWQLLPKILGSDCHTARGHRGPFLSGWIFCPRCWALPRGIGSAKILHHPEQMRYSPYLNGRIWSVELTFEKMGIQHEFDRALTRFLRKKTLGGADCRSAVDETWLDCAGFSKAM